MDINNGGAFSGEFKKIIIQTVKRKTAIINNIKPRFLNLLSNLFNSSIFSRIRN